MRKGNGQGAKLSYAGHALVETRCLAYMAGAAFNC